MLPGLEFFSCLPGFTTISLSSGLLSFAFRSLVFWSIKLFVIVGVGIPSLSVLFSFFAGTFFLFCVSSLLLPLLVSDESCFLFEPELVSLLL